MIIIYFNIPYSVLYDNRERHRRVSVDSVCDAMTNVKTKYSSSCPRPDSSVHQQTTVAVFPDRSTTSAAANYSDTDSDSGHSGRRHLMHHCMELASALVGLAHSRERICL